MNPDLMTALMDAGYLPADDDADNPTVRYFRPDAYAELADGDLVLVTEDDGLVRIVRMSGNGVERWTATVHVNATAMLTSMLTAATS